MTLDDGYNFVILNYRILGSVAAVSARLCSVGVMDIYRDCKDDSDEECGIVDSDYQLSMRQLRQSGDDNGGDAKTGVIIGVLIHWACYLLSRCKCRLVQIFISEDVYRVSNSYSAAMHYRTRYLRT